MFHLNLRTDIQVVTARLGWLALALIAGNLLFNIVANASFKLSAESPNLHGFLVWQVIGNLSGFITVITLTWLLRYIPLNVAFPVTTGLAVIGVQIIAGGFLFREDLSVGQWLGTVLVVAGIALISGR